MRVKKFIASTITAALLLFSVAQPLDVCAKEYGDEVVVEDGYSDDTLIENEIEEADLDEVLPEEALSEEDEIISEEADTDVVEDEGTGYMVLAEDDDFLDVAEDNKAVTEASAHKAIMAMQSKYPTGTPWDNSKFYKWNGGVYSGGYGCAAFAFMLSDAAFGTSKARVHNEFGNLMVGDIVEVKQPGSDFGHSFVVLDVFDTYITIAEGNYNKQVNWGRKIPLDEIKSTGVRVLTRYSESVAVQLKTANASISYKDKSKITARLTTNLADVTELEFSWYVSRGDGNWEAISEWVRGTGENKFFSEYTWMPEEFGDYIIRGKARKIGDDSTVVYSDVNVTFSQYIKGICQMPYTGPGGGYLIGFETYNNPNQEYQYEMLILDCTLLAQNKDAWIYTTGKCKVPENAFWTVWQPVYGYYWTLFRLYDKNGNLIDQSCYGFQNI